VLVLLENRGAATLLGSASLVQGDTKIPENRQHEMDSVTYRLKSLKNLTANLEEPSAVLTLIGENTMKTGYLLLPGTLTRKLTLTTTPALCTVTSQTLPIAYNSYTSCNEVPLRY